jgi:hypothetical protein
MGITRCPRVRPLPLSVESFPRQRCRVGSGAGLVPGAMWARRVHRRSRSCNHAPPMSPEIVAQRGSLSRNARRRTLRSPASYKRRSRRPEPWPRRGPGNRARARQVAAPTAGAARAGPHAEASQAWLRRNGARRSHRCRERSDDADHPRMLAPPIPWRTKSAYAACAPARSSPNCPSRQSVSSHAGADITLPCGRSPSNGCGSFTAVGWTANPMTRRLT